MPESFRWKGEIAIENGDLLLHVEGVLKHVFAAGNWRYIEGLTEPSPLTRYCDYLPPL